MYQLLRSWKQLGLSMQKKAAGNDIYAIALADDDGGVWGSMIHNSQHLDKVVLIGRRGGSRRLYFEIVPGHMIKQSLCALRINVIASQKLILSKVSCYCKSQHR